MTHRAALLLQLLVLSGATTLLLGGWLAADRRSRPDQEGRIAEGRFALASFVSLFLELLLIRWLSSELRIFAYLKNFVLIACFLGFGFGASVSPRRIQMLIPVLGCLALAGSTWLARRQPISLFDWISQAMGEFEDVTMMGKTLWLTGADHLVAMALSCVAVASVFLLVTLIFIPFGQVVGRHLDSAPSTIRAYSLNLVASLLGVWAFTAASFFSTPPWLWFLVALLLCLTLTDTGPWPATIVVTSAVLAALLLFEPSHPSEWTIWSPYQKLRLTASHDADGSAAYELQVNGTWYQRALDLSDRFMATHPELFAGRRQQFDPYNIPFRFQPRPSRVLVVGSGLGNDVAGALRHGAGRVVAVEIDPQILAAGRRLHPEQPYTSPRVDAIVNDARNYFKRAAERFDLIIFGLLDSHTLSSNFANIRLDDYVYTREAFEEARRLLADEGLMIVKFEVQRDWLGKRIQATLAAVFGDPPLLFRDDEGLGARAYVFVAGNPDRIRRRLEVDRELSAFVEAHRVRYPPGPVTMATDDWPFLYHQGRYIPRIYLIFSLLLAGCAAGLARGVFRGGMRGDHWHFFFLGAAFLLLEVQVVSRLALFFGTTWIVNSIVISAILIMILLSNLAAARWHRPPYRLLYTLLLLSIALIHSLPLNRLFLKSDAAKGIAVGGLFCLPVFFAGLIFIASLRATAHKDVAFGANLLGAILGGFLEATSFVAGMRFLLVLAGGLYLLSAITLARVGRAPGRLDTGRPVR